MSTGKGFSDQNLQNRLLLGDNVHIVGMSSYFAPVPRHGSFTRPQTSLQKMEDGKWAGVSAEASDAVDRGLLAGVRTQVHYVTATGFWRYQQVLDLWTASLLVCAPKCPPSLASLSITLW